MRFWEIVCAVCQTFSLASGFWRSGRIGARLFLAGATASIIAAAAQVGLEGYRWQMIPSSAVTILLATMAIRLRSGRYAATGRKRRIAAYLLALAGLLLSVALLAAIPVFSFPTPTGTYAVGTVDYDWVDKSRLEITGDSADKRELTVRLWYPAVPDSTQRASDYVPRLSELAGYVQSRFHIPAMMLGYVRLVHMNAYDQVPVRDSERGYPVILLSHGLPGFGFSSTFMAMELASKGFVVAAIQHTGYAPITALADHRIVPALSKLPSVSDLGAWDRIIDTWAQDDRFVLDRLQLLNANDPGGMWTGKMDLARVGIAGHSFGGAAAVQAMYEDPRIRAGINMDGTLFGSHYSEGLKKPYLQFNIAEAQSTWSDIPPTDAQLAQTGMSRNDYELYRKELPTRMSAVFQNGGYQVYLSGARHMSFSDYYLWSPLLRVSDKVKLPANRAHTIVNAYTVAFFDHYLNGLPAPLLDPGRQEYSEAKLSKK